jgi:hypothetical protein
MKSIATQHGDGGKTRLIGGAEVSKSDLRVEAYGAIDELGAGLGFARSISGDDEINQLTKEIQRELFLVAGSVANPRALQKQPPDVTPAMTDRLTREVNRLEAYSPTGRCPATIPRPRLMIWRAPSAGARNGAWCACGKRAKMSATKSSAISIVFRICCGCSVEQLSCGRA